MKRIIFIALLMMTLANVGHAQGWVAEVYINLIDPSCGGGEVDNIYIDRASVSFGGVTQGETFMPTQSVTIILNGTGTPDGNVNVSAQGQCFYGGSVSEQLFATHSFYCEESRQFDSGAGSGNAYVLATLVYHPRIKIINIDRYCTYTRLQAEACLSENFKWEVAENPSGPFEILSGKTTATIDVTPDEIYNAGLNSKYGPKYFRATGIEGTTSQITEAVNIYYPGPELTVNKTDPKCFNDYTGTVTVNMVTSYPSITDFDVMLYKGADFVKQEPVSGSSYTFNGLDYGNYNVVVSNNSAIGTYGNCSSQKTAPALINPEKVRVTSFTPSNRNGYTISCAGGNDGTLTANIAGGTGTYTEYQWTPNVSATNYASGLTVGNYTVKIKDSNNCWSDVHQTTVTQPDPLNVTLQSTGGTGGYDVTCWNINDGVLQANVTGGAGSKSYSWNTGSTATQISGLAAPGPYNILITDGNGCTATANKTLTAPLPINFNIDELEPVSCSGFSDGSLGVNLLSIQNAIGNKYYSWSSGENAYEIVNKQAGLYSVTVSDDQGCSTTKSRTLDAPKPYRVTIEPRVFYNGSMIKCYGESNGKLGTIVKDDNGQQTTASNYNWYKNNVFLRGGNTKDTINQVDAGNYKVIITYGAGCVKDTTFNLTAPPQVTATISNVSNYNGFPISCDGESDGSIAALGGGGTGASYTYAWNTGATTATLPGLNAGSYSVIVKDVNLCIGTASKVLNDPDPVNPSIAVLSNYNGQAISCYNASDGRLRASTTGGAGSFSYAWNTGASGQDLINIPAGTYTVTSTDINGCTGTKAQTIINPTPVKALITQISNYTGFGVRCKGGSDGSIQAAGSGGTGVYSFAWSASTNTNALRTGLPAGNYTVTVSDNNGCSNANDTTITEPTIVTLSLLDSKNITCYDSLNGEIRLQAGGGAGTYQYSSDNVNWKPSPVFTGLAAQSYTMRVRDVNSCQQSFLQTLTRPTKLVIDFTNIEPALCNDPKGKATAVVTGGVGGYTYQWRDAGNNLFDTDATITDRAAGIYTLTSIDGNSCPVIQSVGITSPDGAQTNAINIVAAKCFNSADGSGEIGIISGDGPFTYLWPNGQTTKVGTGLLKGDHIVAITDSNNCTVTQNVTIPAPADIVLDLIQSTIPACNGDCNGKLKVNASGGAGSFVYTWGSFIGSEISNICAGDHAVKVTDGNGCFLEKTFNLMQPDPVRVSLSSLQSASCYNLCDGSIEVSAAGGNGSYQYVWSNGINNANSGQICPGSYTVTVMDAKACTVSETFTLVNPPVNAVDLGGSVTLCVGQSHLLNAGSSWNNYKWTSNTGFTSNEQVIIIKEPGQYLLEVSNNKGCIARDTFLLATSLDLLKANFIMTTQASVGDTVVLIDVSWPLPENITWNYPAEMSTLADMGDIVYGQFDEAGEFKVTLNVRLGECLDVMTKTITILKDKDEPDGGRLGYEDFVKVFELYPNPNDGSFDVGIELLEESAVTLSVWNTVTSNMVGQVSDKGKKSYLKHVDFRPLSSGKYVLRLDHAKGHQYIRFIVH